MKPVGLISAAALLLLFGAAAPGYAQQDPHEKDSKPAKQEEKAKPEKTQQEKPAKTEHQQEAKAQHERESKPEKQEQNKPAKPEHQQQAKAQEQQAKSAKQEHEQQAKTQHDEKAKPEKQRQEKSARNEHEQQARSEEQHQHAQRSEAEQQRQRSAPALRLSVRGQGRIPEERFHSNFGHEHRFRIGNPRIVGGYSRFQYGGYWFGFVEPWPEGWYYTDDVYVDYVDDGYYLYNPYYPGVRIAINVVM